MELCRRLVPTIKAEALLLLMMACVILECSATPIRQPTETLNVELVKETKNVAADSPHLLKIIKSIIANSMTKRREVSTVNAGPVHGKIPEDVSSPAVPPNDHRRIQKRDTHDSDSSRHPRRHLPDKKESGRHIRHSRQRFYSDRERPGWDGGYG